MKIQIAVILSVAGALLSACSDLVPAAVSSGQVVYGIYAPEHAQDPANQDILSYLTGRGGFQILPLLDMNFLDGLNLSAGQHAAVLELQDQLLAGIQDPEVRQAGWAAFEQALQTSFKADSFDPAALPRPSRADHLDLQLQTLKGLYDLLSEAQRAQLARFLRPRSEQHMIEQLAMAAPAALQNTFSIASALSLSQEQLQSLDQLMAEQLRLRQAEYSLQREHGKQILAQFEALLTSERSDWEPLRISLTPLASTSLRNQELAVIHDVLTPAQRVLWLELILPA